MRYFIAISLMVLSAHYAWSAFSPEHTSCPEQNWFHHYSQERKGPGQVRFWFGGRLFRWTPMHLDVKVPMPYKSNAKPSLAFSSMALTHHPDSGDWTISCTYMEDSGFGQAINYPTTTLTYSSKEAQDCKLNERAKVVNCKKPSADKK